LLVARAPGHAATVAAVTAAAPAPMTLTFAGGTLELRGLGPEAPPPTPACVWDVRTACYRAPAVAYAAVRRALARAGREVDDRARQYAELPEGARVQREPRP